MLEGRFLWGKNSYLRGMKVVTSKAEDQKLVDGLRTGSNPVIREIYNKFFQSIKGNVKNWGGTEDDAKDIFQEAVMVIYRLVRKPDFKLSSAFYSLLYPVCRNLWLKEIRNRSRMGGGEEIKELEGVGDRTDIVEAINEREIDRLFRNKIEELGDQCRNLMEMFFQGRSMKEIVTELGLSSISFAKKKKFQCKEKLVKLVQGDALFRELRY